MSKTPSQYINKVPVLTAARLGEFYRGLLDVTGDRQALAEITYFASGGMRIEIRWTQNGHDQNYVATLPQVKIAARAEGENADALFTEFAQATIDAVRAIGNAMLIDPPAEPASPEGEAS